MVRENIGLFHRSGSPKGPMTTKSITTTQKGR